MSCQLPRPGSPAYLRAEGERLLAFARNELLAHALGIIERRFREAGSGLLRERWDRTWRRLDGYRGGNSNMHAIEALLAASDATGDRALADQGVQIADYLVNSIARHAEWRVVEHFDEYWSPARSAWRAQSRPGADR